MIISAIVATARNLVIGHQNQIPWYLPADLVRAIKHRAIDEQLSLSALVERVLTQYLGAQR